MMRVTICLARALVAMVACIPVTDALAASATQPLRLCYEDVAQGYWTTPDGGGVGIDLLRKVEARLGEQFVFAPMPWKRCLEEVRVGSMDAAIGAAEAPERKEYAVYPALPDGMADARLALWIDAFNIFYRHDSKAGWNGRELVAPGGAVLVQRSYVIGGILRERGYKVVEAGKSVEDCLRLLKEGSVEVAALQGAQAEWLRANDVRFRSVIRKAPTPYAVLPMYLMASRMSFEREPARIRAIWSEVRKLRATAEYRKLEEAGARTYSGD